MILLEILFLTWQSFHMKYFLHIHKNILFIFIYYLEDIQCYVKINAFIYESFNCLSVEIHELVFIQPKIDWKFMIYTSNKQGFPCNHSYNIFINFNYTLLF